VLPKPAAPAAAAAAKSPVDLTRKAMDQASGGAPPLRSVNAPIGRAPAPGGVPRVGRNDDCPCGSGKKYKKCHGASAA
jgi:preprotein translocase subunit SecA